MKKIGFKIAFVSLFIISPTFISSTFALGMGMGGGMGVPAPCGGPFGTVCPIDGGVSLLIAAGAALGGKKAFDLKKKKAS